MDTYIGTDLEHLVDQVKLTISQAIKRCMHSNPGYLPVLMNDLSHLLGQPGGDRLVANPQEVHQSGTVQPTWTLVDASDQRTYIAKGVPIFLRDS